MELQEKQQLLSQIDTVLTSLGSEAQPCQYLHWLTEALPGTQNQYFQEKLLPRIQQSRAMQDRTPFLSIIVRTQGNRLEELQEVFLSLYGQSDTDYEILLVVHKATEAAKEKLRALVDAQLPFLQERIRLFFLDTGTRTAPLNLGASMAYGRYFTCLDDDDVVLEHWVEAFHRGANAHPGQVIRCYGMTQAWSAELDDNGKKQLASVGSRKMAYCQPFQLFLQLHENRTPISCMAIPTACFQEIGIYFDETLTTTEDWDYFMRCALLLGVHDTEEVTFLYRIWTNAPSSATLHQQKEWDRNREYIIEKMNKIPLLTTRKALYAQCELRRAESAFYNEAVAGPRGFTRRLRDFINRRGILLAPFFMIWRLMVYTCTHLIPHPVPKELIPKNPGTFERISIAVRNYGLLLLPFVAIKKFVCYFFTHLFRSKAKEDSKEASDAQDSAAA